MLTFFYLKKLITNNFLLIDLKLKFQLFYLRLILMSCLKFEVCKSLFLICWSHTYLFLMGDSLFILVHQLIHGLDEIIRTIKDLYYRTKMSNSRVQSTNTPQICRSDTLQYCSNFIKLIQKGCQHIGEALKKKNKNKYL